jgi:hypothetical protein
MKPLVHGAGSRGRGPHGLLSPEDNNPSQVSRFVTSLQRGGADKFPVNAKPRFSKPADTDPNYQVPQPIPTFRPAEKCEQIMITTILALAAMLVLVLFPVLVPAIITAGHVILGTNRPGGRVGSLQPAAA